MATDRVDPEQTGGAEAAILAALSDLLLEERPLDDISVAEVIARADVARATFYFYFASKDDAFVALLRAHVEQVLPAFEALLGDAGRRRSPDLRADLAGWMDVSGPSVVVIGAAAEEWPRRADVREAYLGAQRRLAAVLARAVDEDRAAGVAVPGIPSAELASGWLWTMERCCYEAFRGAPHLEDGAAVRDALAATLVAAVYGR